MANISVSLPSDGTTADVADYNTPITTIVNEINGNLDNSNIAAAAAIAGSKLADAGVTPQKITLPYKFSANRSTAQSLGAGASTLVIFTTEDYDTNSNYNNATGVYTAPVAGFYNFQAAVSVNASSATTMYISVFKNGAEIRRGDRIITGTLKGLVIATDIQLAATDTVDIRVFTSVSFSTEANAVANFFTGRLVSIT